jgi:hypothetical protein
MERRLRLWEAGDLRLSRVQPHFAVKIISEPLPILKDMNGEVVKAYVYRGVPVEFHLF